MKAHIAQKLAEIRQRQKPPEPEPLGIEKHYTCEQIADLWGVSVRTVQNIFAHRDDIRVLKIGAVKVGRKTRGFAKLRIPESTVNRVHAEMSK